MTRMDYFFLRVPMSFYVATKMRRPNISQQHTSIMIMTAHTQSFSRALFPRSSKNVKLRNPLNTLGSFLTRSTGMARIDGVRTMVSSIARLSNLSEQVIIVIMRMRGLGCFLGCGAKPVRILLRCVKKLLAILLDWSDLKGRLEWDDLVAGNLSFNLVEKPLVQALKGDWSRPLHEIFGRRGDEYAQWSKEDWFCNNCWSDSIHDAMWRWGLAQKIKGSHVPTVLER